MRTKPLSVRPLTDAERQVLQDSLRASDAFALRRAQIVLASAAGERSGQIAPRVGFTTQGIRNVIHAFNARGLDVLRPGSHHPGVVVSAFDTPRALALRDLLHQSPRLFNKPTSVWTLNRAAQVSFEHGLLPDRVSGETIRLALKRLGVGWKRDHPQHVGPHGRALAAGQGVDHQPRPGVRPQKSAARPAAPAGPRSSGLAARVRG